MKILLIGKYPPIQGGISTKTYWLYRHLRRKGFDFKIVTVYKDNYSIDAFDENESVSVIKDRDIPWHIPESKLLDDRIISKAHFIAKSFNPDLIETNYLWPFNKDALLISILLNKPLLIRHAGSDIAKFINDEEFSVIFNLYCEQADLIVTNRDYYQLLKKRLPNETKVKCLKRYIPDPDIFMPYASKKTYDVLFSGKINYHWRYKGLIELCEKIKYENWKALFLIDGDYRKDVIELIDKQKLSDLITVSRFIHPENMPSVYNSSRSVWLWENRSTPDFSNIIWEAAFCSVPCIVNDEVSMKIQNESTLQELRNLFYLKNEIRPAPDGQDISSLNERKRNLFEEYIRENICVYEEMIKKK